MQHFSLYTRSGDTYFKQGPPKCKAGVPASKCKAGVPASKSICDVQRRVQGFVRAMLQRAFNMNIVTVSVQHEHCYSERST